MGLLAFAASILATLGGASPTGVGFVDVLYVGAAGATLALAGGRSRRVPWLISAVAALWLAPTTFLRVAALIAVGLAVYAAATRRRRAVGAAIGTLVAFVLGGLDAGPFHGSTTLLAIGVAAPILASAVVLMTPDSRRAIAVASSTALLASLAAICRRSVLRPRDRHRAPDQARRDRAAGSSGREGKLRRVLEDRRATRRRPLARSLRAPVR